MEVDCEEQHTINGCLMKNYVGKPVRLYLKVENVSTGGNKVQGITTDKRSIDIELDQPLNQPLTGWIEVMGTPSSAVAIECSEIIVFPNDENSEPFDEEAHNGIVLALDNMKDFLETGELENH